jgi:hexokinase
MSDFLVAHRLSLREAESAITKDAREIREGVVSLAEEIREIRALINQMRETEIPAREMFLNTIGEERKAIQGAAESILDISAKRILMAIAAAYVMGLASYPVILALVRALWKQL